MTERSVTTRNASKNADGPRSVNIATASAKTPSGGNTQADETVRELGAQIRRLRNRRKMTLGALADETGLSVSMLSMLERGAATPSIGTLVAVSSALGTHMSDLFDSASTADRSPVRRLADQIEVETAEGVLRRLVHNDPLSGLELVVNEYEPGTSSGEGLTHHAGTEFGVVLTGTLTVELEDGRHVLKPGDGITYSSMRPHRISNAGRTKARAIWVNIDA
jgi:transcriptional regulator with XRE-family HTH domain